LGIEYITLLVVGVMILLMIAGVPLAWITMSLAVGCTLAWLGPAGLPLVASRVYGFVNEYVFVAVPLFVLMACILERSGVAKDLYDAMRLFAGRLPGGVAVQTTLVAMVMAAMTGIIGGEIVLLGLIALPQMLRLGYDRNLAIGIICAGGSLGTMIPPSIVLIFYGLTANVPIGELFIAVVMPGLLLASIYLVYTLMRCGLRPELGPPLPAAERDMPLRAKFRLLGGLVLPMGIAFAVLGAIYAGVAAVSEAAAVGVAGSIFAAWVRGTLTWQLLRECMQQTMSTCGLLLWLTFGATALIGVYNLLGGIRFIHDAMGELPFAPIVVILLMMAVLVVLGMFMDWVGILLLTMPIFVPIIKNLGYDPIWFGILFCMNMQISYLSPPFGPAAFYLKSVAPPEISLQDIFRGLWPFMLMQFTGVLMVILFPEIALWLPRLLRSGGP
jgi:tripartite ATP-independent transporter DctM subunit